MTSRPYDFLHPEPFTEELLARLRRWLAELSDTLGRRWQSHLPYRLTVELPGYQTGRAEELCSALHPSSIGMSLLSEGRPVGFTCGTAPTASALVVGLLGDSPEQMPEVQELTPVEAALLEVLVEELVAALREVWPGTEAPALASGRAPEPVSKLRRLVEPYDNVISFPLAIRAPFGEGGWWVIFSVRWFVDTLTGQKAEPNDWKAEEALAPLPLEVRAVLGTAELPLAELRRLQPGDVILLDQPVDQPLRVCLNGRACLRAWPGRVGSRQAISLERVVSHTSAKPGT
jgi:flagellar motor switch protein FliM